MGKKAFVAALILTVALLAELAIVEQATFPNIKAQRPWNFNVDIAHPINNGLYIGGLIDIGVDVTVDGVENPQVFMNYSLDGASNGSIPYSTDSYVPFLVTWFYGKTSLQVTQGKHNLTITDGMNGIPLNVTTFHFTVNLFEPPVITNLTIENRTYTTNTLALNFTTSEPTSWIGYSLDGKADVTVTGNTTLSGLTDGSHSLLIHANDSLGNVGWSNTVFFTIDTSTPSPSPSPTQVSSPSDASSQTEQPPIEPSPTASLTPIAETGNANLALEVLGAIAIIIVIVSVLVYFAKCKGVKQ